MDAMVLEQPGRPLVWRQGLPLPVPGAGQVRLRVAACGVCRTDLHVVDGELPHPRQPLVPGHEIVGHVEAVGAAVVGLVPGDRVGVPWLGRTCGHCRYCAGGRENLCDTPGFTGYTLDGGYATHALAQADYCVSLKGLAMGDVQAAPLLCAGLIGWRSLVMAGPAEVLGLYGFGAAAHLVIQVARAQGRRVLAFTRPGDTPAQEFARSLGAQWAGGSDETPPEPLDAAILFAPVGALVPAALAAVRKGGRVVCGGIHMSDIPTFPYRLLWEERQLLSVANLTRRDAADFIEEARRLRLVTHTKAYPLAQANEALADLRAGRLQGAAVLVPAGTLHDDGEHAR